MNAFELKYGAKKYDAFRVSDVKTELEDETKSYSLEDPLTTVSQPWEDEVIAHEYSQFKRDQINLSNMMVNIKCFWLNYLGVKDTAKIGEIMLAILAYFPHPEDMSKSFFEDLEHGDKKSNPINLTPVMTDIISECGDDVFTLAEIQKTMRKETKPIVAAVDTNDLPLAGPNTSNQEGSEPIIIDSEIKDEFVTNLLTLFNNISPSPEADQDKAKTSTPAVTIALSEDLRVLMLTTCYTILICGRRMVKSADQLNTAFSKDRISNNYHRLIPGALSGAIPPPAMRFNERLGSTLNRGGKLGTRLLVLTLTAYSVSAPKTTIGLQSLEGDGKSTRGLLEATLLRQIALTGMQLVALVQTCSARLGIGVRELLTVCSFTSTKSSISNFLTFMAYLRLPETKVSLIWWSRVYKDSFHSDLTGDKNAVLCFALATVIDKCSDPEERSNCTGALWIKKIGAKEKELGESLAIKLMSEANKECAKALDVAKTALITPSITIQSRVTEEALGI